MITVVKPGHELITPAVMIQAQRAIIERAGRTCYKSEGKIKDGSVDRFIRGLIKSGHESVIEHGSVTVRIICDRSCSHQLVRHRIAAYSQESQRYCDYGKLGLQVICPPKIADLKPGTYEEGMYGWHDPDEEVMHGGLATGWLSVVDACYRLYLDLREEGIPPEDARSVLPNATKTEVVTTFNLRQWRHVFKERALNPRAQWQIREILLGILKEFAELLPAVFGDLLEVEG